MFSQFCFYLTLILVFETYSENVTIEYISREKLPRSDPHAHFVIHFTNNHWSSTRSQISCKWIWFYITVNKQYYDDEVSNEVAFKWVTLKAKVGRRKASLQPEYLLQKAQQGKCIFLYRWNISMSLNRNFKHSHLIPKK